MDCPCFSNRCTEKKGNYSVIEKEIKVIKIKNVLKVVKFCFTY